MKKLIIIIFGLMYLIFSTDIYAQKEECSKIKIVVNLGETIDELYDFFKVQYPIDSGSCIILPGFGTGQTEKDWKSSVHDYFFNFLQECNPTVQFISEGGDDCSYSISYVLSKKTIYDDDPDCHKREIGCTGYYASGYLSTSNACGKNNRVVDSFGEDLDLLQAIKNMAAGFGPIDRVLYNYEKDHLSPPRGPRILASKKDRNYVSPLENERKIEINLQVRNCKNEIVYYGYQDGQVVELQTRTNRAKLKNNANQGASLTVRDGNPLLIGIYRPKTASVFYTLKKGINPEIEKIVIETCGRDEKETKTIEIIIDGLEILVKPQKTVIKSSEKTSIDIYFNTVSPNGKKRPIANKQLNLSIKGIVDGKISPLKTVTTNSEGKATLQYKAGENDKKITIAASYQPVNYPDIVTGSSYVKINSKDSDATLSITSRYLREIKKDREDDNGDTKTSQYIKDQSGTITLQLKKHSEINYEDLLGLGLHWVYYQSTSRSLNNWHIDYYDHRDEESKNHSFTYREDAEISNVKIKTPDYPIMVIIMYDTETKKAKYVIVQASLIMGYEMNISIDTQSTDKNGTTSDSRTDYKKESYNFEIVGDEIHDSKLNKKFPSGALAKGSKNTFTGYGETEEVKSLSETYFHEERKLKTSQWTMTIND